ncbi:hypothetical protein P7L70_05930 (plasmid) [Tistrella mobilis]
MEEVLVEEDRMADMVEAIWQRAGRQLQEAGFTPIQAREVIHIMEYILPQSVREQTRLMAKDIAEESTKTLRAEIRNDIAAFEARMIEKLSDRTLTDFRFWRGLLIGGLVTFIVTVSAAALKGVFG